MSPGLREKLVAEKKAKLSPQVRATLDIPAAKRTPAQSEAAYTALNETAVSDREVAERIAKEHPEKSKQVLQLASELDRETLRLRYTINYKSDSNYDYWQMRAKLEQTPDALAAREAMFRASRTFREGDPFGAKKLYEEGFAKWRKVFDAFPESIDSESSTGDDLIQYILQYRNVLDQMDEELDRSLPALGRDRALRHRAKAQGRADGAHEAGSKTRKRPATRKRRQLLQKSPQRRRRIVAAFSAEICHICLIAIFARFSAVFAAHIVVRHFAFGIAGLLVDTTRRDRLCRCFCRIAPCCAAGWLRRAVPASGSC